MSWDVSSVERSVFIVPSMNEQFPQHDAAAAVPLIRPELYLTKSNEITKTETERFDLTGINKN